MYLSTKEKLVISEKCKKQHFFAAKCDDQLVCGTIPLSVGDCGEDKCAARQRQQEMHLGRQLLPLWHRGGEGHGGCQGLFRWIQTTCGDCEKSNSDRLDQVLEDKWENQHQLRDYLEREKDWFRGLDQSWKDLLVKQGMIKMWQGDMTLGIEEMIWWTKEVLFGDSHLNADALTDGSYEEKLSVSQLMEIQALFQGIRKGPLGQLVHGEESKKFLCAALGSPEGGLAKLMEIFILRLKEVRSTGTTFWEMRICDAKVHHFSELLLFGSFVLRRVALAMKGEVQEGADFVSRLRTIHAQAEAACSCTRSQTEVYGG